MSATETHIRISSSDFPREPSPVPPVDQALVHALPTQLQDAVGQEKQVDVRSSQPRRTAPGPIIVTIDEDDCYIASDLAGAVYGAGASESEAVAEFYRALDEHFVFLRSHHHELHPRLEDQLAALERLFPER